MELSLTTETDSINILAFNVGPIAVDIDGIELADLINVVCYMVSFSNADDAHYDSVNRQAPCNPKHFRWR